MPGKTSVTVKSTTSVRVPGGGRQGPRANTGRRPARLGSVKGSWTGPGVTPVELRLENRGQGPVGSDVAVRVTSASGAVPVAGRASVTPHMPAQSPVTTGPGGGTGQRARAVAGRAGRIVSQGPNRTGRALARGRGRQGPRANTWRRLCQQRGPIGPPVSRAGQRARATLKLK